MRRVRPFLLAAAALVLAASAGASPAALSDEFDDAASLARWTIFDGDFGPSAVRVADGALDVVTPTSWWVNGDRAFYLHKRVTGDFVATARVNVTGVDGPMPTRNWSLSGLLVRSASSRPERENRVALRTGVVDGSWPFERKTTVASQSVLVLSSAPGGWTEAGPESPDLRLRADWVRFRSTGIPARLRTRFVAGKVARTAILRYVRR